MDFKILCLGDVVGRPGRELLKARLGELRRQKQINFVICNAENSAGGLGIDPTIADELHAGGCDVLTLGDHTWDRRVIFNSIDERSDWLIRPLNYPSGVPNYPCGVPGRGWTIRQCEGLRIAVVNLMGRVFFNFPLDCPFQCMQRLFEEIRERCDLILVDMHAEATSEKVAMGLFLDGRATAVFGTHTHVPTADHRLLPQGTAFVTDLGMCGPTQGVIGMAGDLALKRFLGGLPTGYEVAKGPSELQGVIISVDRQSLRPTGIVRLAEGAELSE